MDNRTPPITGTTATTPARPPYRRHNRQAAAVAAYTVGSGCIEQKRRLSSMGRSEKVPAAARMRGATQETRATADDDGKMASRGVPVELSAAPRAYIATINRDELPSVEEALARLSGVMQDGVEWLMAQDKADDDKADDDKADDDKADDDKADDDKADDATQVALDDGANQDSIIQGEGDTANEPYERTGRPAIHSAQGRA